jgi:hypothetical protein
MWYNAMRCDQEGLVMSVKNLDGGLGLKMCSVILAAAAGRLGLEWGLKLLYMKML